MKQELDAETSGTAQQGVGEKLHHCRGRRRRWILGQNDEWPTLRKLNVLERFVREYVSF
jgi:hypothetical protein